MSDIFHRAAELEDATDRLLERQYDRISSDSHISSELADPPDTTSALSTAEARLNPAYLAPGTRAKFFKRLVLRFLRVYYRGQVEFNAAIFQVLSAWDTRLRKLLLEILDLLKHKEERTAQKLLITERRWDELESKQTSDILALGERIGETEQDIVRLEETILNHDKKSKAQQTELQGIFISLNKVESLIREDRREVDDSILKNRKEIETSLSEIRSDNETKLLPLQEEIAAVVKHSEFLATTLHQLRTDFYRLQKYQQDFEKQALSPAMYFEFENINRGTREEIRDRQKVYVPILKRFAEKFQDGAKFIDLGCGRGELLEITLYSGIDMVGFDQNPGMIANCRSSGLKASEGDLMESLSSYPNQSLAGVTALQVIEHLTYSQIASLLELAREKIRPGGCIILETINPLSVYAMRHFYMDPTHRQPIPATTCEFFVKAYGFVDPEILLLSPVENNPALKALQLENKNQPLSDMLFGYQDYAVIAMKP